MYIYIYMCVCVCACEHAYNIKEKLIDAPFIQFNNNIYSIYFNNTINLQIILSDYVCISVNIYFLSRALFYDTNFFLFLIFLAFFLICLPPIRHLRTITGEHCNKINSYNSVKNTSDPFLEHTDVLNSLVVYNWQIRQIHSNILTLLTSVFLR